MRKTKHRQKIGNKETNKQWKCEIGLTFNTDSEKTKKKKIKLNHLKNPFEIK